MLYTSEDGIHWDEGEYLCLGLPRAGAFYSNNLVLDEDDGGQRVIIQSSVPWENWLGASGEGDGRVNICHWTLEIE